MQTTGRTDEDLLAARDATSFELFYLRHVDTLLGFFARRTGDPELAADLTSETFAAVLAGRRRYRPAAGTASAWLFGIAHKKLADAQRRGYAERRMCRRLGMERLELTDQDIARIQSLGERSAGALLEGLAVPQREAVRAHVIDERGYGEIARELQTSEAVVRKRVSRGLATARERMGGRRR
jgi:RNA polymerase sigma factor (sigma-70 family)